MSRLERRELGRSGIRVSELGVSVAPGAAGAVRRAVELGVDLFHVGRSEDLPWLAGVLGPRAATLLVGTGMPAVGPGYHPDSPDGSLRILSLSALADQPGAMGPFQVLGGWDLGKADPTAPPGRLEAARRSVGDGTSLAVSAPYAIEEQRAGFEFFRAARRAGLGVIAAEVAAPDAQRYDWLRKPSRTLRQAAIQFVMANEYVTAALAPAATAEEVSEAAAFVDAPGLTIPEVERVIEMYIHRDEPCGPCGR